MPRSKIASVATAIARWRHMELLVWGFSMLMAYHWATWNFSNVNPTVLLIGISLIPLYYFRQKYPYPKILYALAPLGYIIFVVGAISFLQHFTSHWITWGIAVFAAVSIVETVFFDVYFAYPKVMRKVFGRRVKK